VAGIMGRAPWSAARAAPVWKGGEKEIGKK